MNKLLKLFGLIRKTQIKDELIRANQAGARDMEKVKDEEIELLHADYKHEMFLMSQEHAAEMELKCMELAAMKKDKKKVNALARDVKQRQHVLSTVASKMTFNFDKATLMVSGLLQSFAGFDNELKELKKIER